MNNIKPLKNNQSLTGITFLFLATGDQLYYCMHQKLNLLCLSLINNSSSASASATTTTTTTTTVYYLLSFYLTSLFIQI